MIKAPIAVINGLTQIKVIKASRHQETIEVLSGYGAR